jgi:hypothetical protein
MIRLAVRDEGSDANDDAKSAFAGCGHAAGLALGSNVPIVLKKYPK